MRGLRPLSAVPLLFLPALVLVACGTTVPVAHTIPPDYNLAPVKTVALIGGSQVSQDEGLTDRVLRYLQDRDAFEVVDRRDLSAQLGSATHQEIVALGQKIGAEVILRVTGPFSDSAHQCRAVSQGDNTIQTRDTDGKRVTETISTNWVADCGARLEIFDARKEDVNGGFTAWGHSDEATSDDGSSVWDEAMEDAAWQIVDGVTPRQVNEEVAIDQKAPFAKEGIARIDADDLAGARAVWEKVAETDKASAALRYNLGAVCEALGDARSARRYYRAAIRLAQGGPDAPKYQAAFDSLAGRKVDARVSAQGDAARSESAQPKVDEAAVAAAKAEEEKADEAKTEAARARASGIGRAPRAVEKTAESYLLLPAGTFVMGCTAGDPSCAEDERPPHSVTIGKPFYLASTLTTKSSYQRCIDAGACQGDTDRAKPSEPAVAIRWSDAAAFCQWVGGRLPTEAEWEYAARGGVEGWRYPWGNSIAPENANYATSLKPFEFDSVASLRGLAPGLTYRYSGTCPVKTFPANGFGLYDMAGNALEWTADWAGSYLAGPAADPKGPATGTVRILRGGSWAVTGGALRVSNRFTYGPENQEETIGFRCAIDP